MGTAIGLVYAGKRCVHDFSVLFGHGVCDTYLWVIPASLCFPCIIQLFYAVYLPGFVTHFFVPCVAMEKTHIVRIHHPSGLLYESWQDFARKHAGNSHHQSEAFYRVLSHAPGLQAILLLLRNEAEEVRGSLLGYVSGSGSGLLARFRGHAVSLGTPLLLPQRRLQQHLNMNAMLKAFVKEARPLSGRISIYVFEDVSDFHPVFHANGFSWSDAQAPLPELPALSAASSGASLPGQSSAPDEPATSSASSLSANASSLSVAAPASAGLPEQCRGRFVRRVWF